MTTDKCPYWSDGEHVYVVLFGGYVKRCGCLKEVKPTKTEEEILAERDAAARAAKEKPPA